MTPDQSPESESPGPMRWTDVVTDALRYWEPRRLLYNVVLAAVTIGQLIVQHALPRPASSGAALLFILAVGANILYSAAYVVDLFVQASAYRSSWRHRRGLLWLLGTLLGALLAYFITQSMFVSSG